MEQAVSPCTCSVGSRAPVSQQVFWLYGFSEMEPQNIGLGRHHRLSPQDEDRVGQDLLLTACLACEVAGRQSCENVWL